MKALDDGKVLRISHKYRLSPGSIKCQAFTLFEQGYPRSDVRYLLRRFRKPQNAKTFTDTIRRYHELWKSKQEKYR